MALEPQRERKQDAAGQELSRHVGLLAEANVLLKKHMALKQGHQHQLLANT